MPSNYNVVFIIIDALRARNLSCYGYYQKTTPNIDSLAEKGVLFENTFSCTNVTDSSLTSIFSGKYPINHGIISHGMKLQATELGRIGKIPFLHEILKSHGYTTLAVDWLKRWHMRNYDVYFDPYHGQRDPHGIRKQRSSKYKALKAVADVLRLLKLNKIYRKGKRVLKYGREAEAVTEAAVKLIKRNASNNFFIFVHYWDTHSICNPPQSFTDKFYHHKGNLHDQSIERMLSQIQNEGRRSYLKKYLGKSPNLDYVLAKYYGAIAYVDHEVGRLMNEIKKNHLLENTLIVITSDHGESLTEHGIFFDHHGLYDASIHVPLILAGPKLPEGRRIKGLIQHVDLAPTILEILDLPVQNKKNFDGSSLTPLINGDKEELHPAVFAEEAYYERKRAVRTKRYKYITALSKEEGLCRCCNLIHGALEELYDLNDDPQELQNIVKNEPKVRNTFKKMLFEWVRSFEETKLNESTEEKISPEYEKEVEVMERLRKLGYF